MATPRSRVRRIPLPAATAGIFTIALSTVSAAGPRNTSRTLAETLMDGPGESNHPVHVVPSEAIEIPQDWPLEVDGSITCLTCHTKVPSLDGSPSPQLRDFDGPRAESARFCGRCHGRDGGRQARNMHWTAMRSAHIRDEDSYHTRRSTRLDTESRRCLGCHDGVNAKESRNTLGMSVVRSLDDLKTSHPVGVDYPDRQTQRQTGQYRQATALPHQVRLPNGKVSCVSCHNLYSKERHLLTVPMERSALCVTCHNK